MELYYPPRQLNRMIQLVQGGGRLEEVQVGAGLGREEAEVREEDAREVEGRRAVQSLRKRKQRYGQPVVDQHVQPEGKEGERR
jgi:hypothetical protein